MDIRQYVANNWNDFLDIIEGITCEFDAYCWFRGQADEKWQLLPSVKRHPFNQKNKEQYLATDFYIEACRRLKELPVDKAGWISLMQHYGLPTRLLDWSESPLVAMYFALEQIEKFSQTDSAIWALNPQGLNASMGYQGYLFPMDFEIVEEYIKPAFNFEKEPGKIIACCSVENDLRMYIQQSAFTVHSSDQPIERLDTCQNYLRKIIIPSYTKEKFSRQLRLCGFKLSNIYPDIEHISKELKDMFS